MRCRYRTRRLCFVHILGLWAIAAGLVLELPAANQKASEEERFWSFRPVRAVAPPAVRDQEWARSPIDQFILAGLDARGLVPAPAADRRTLLRRATFDLTGIPPTPDEVETF